MHTRFTFQRKHGFSLVELSIVLVILGLLAGGILAGKSLIRASELRAVSTEHSRYVTVTQAFRDKYFMLPGDMSNATRFWGRLNSNTDCVTNSSAGLNTTTGSCDGDGDGMIEGATSVSESGEMFQYWRQLTAAGMIEGGNYTGIAGPTAGSTGQDSIIGTNVPSSKLANAGWSARFQGDYSGDNYAYDYNYGHMLAFGRQTSGYVPSNGMLTPAEAWNIDTKIDDGKPASGKVLPRTYYAYGNANACTTATDNDDATGVYALSLTTWNACSIYFANVF